MPVGKTKVNHFFLNFDTIDYKPITLQALDKFCPAFWLYRTLNWTDQPRECATVAGESGFKIFAIFSKVCRLQNTSPLITFNSSFERGF